MKASTFFYRHAYLKFVVFFILLAKVPSLVNKFPNSILVTVNAYNFANHEGFINLFGSYRDICEAGWYIKVVVLTTAVWSNDTLRMLNERMFCYQTNASIPIEIWKYNRNVGPRIVEHSREPTRAYILDFDLFLYVEGYWMMLLILFSSYI